MKTESFMEVAMAIGNTDPATQTFKQHVKFALEATESTDNEENAVRQLESMVRFAFKEWRAKYPPN